jgi:hypothetical protein
MFLCFSDRGGVRKTIGKDAKQGGKRGKRVEENSEDDQSEHDEETLPADTKANHLKQFKHMMKVVDTRDPIIKTALAPLVEHFCDFATTYATVSDHKDYFHSVLKIIPMENLKAMLSIDKNKSLRKNHQFLFQHLSKLVHAKEYDFIAETKDAISDVEQLLVKKTLIMITMAYTTGTARANIVDNLSQDALTVMEQRFSDKGAASDSKGKSGFLSRLWA